MTTEITPYQQPADLDLVAVRLEPERYPRLFRFGRESAVNLLAQVVAMAYNYTGRTYEAGDLRLVASGLYAELMRDQDGVGMRYITIAEVGYAIRAAILAQESMYGINVASLYKAVRAYCLGAGHDAQVAAASRISAQRQQALRRSPAGAMLESYAGAMLKNITTK